MHLSVLVVHGHVFFKASVDSLVVNLNGALRGRGGGVYDNLEDVKEFAGVSAALAQQCVSLAEHHLTLAEYGVGGKRAVKQKLQVIRSK